MKINCLVVDDEQYARKLLAGYIEKIPNLNLTHQCKNALEAMQVLQQQQIDLLFLDIQMPDLTGVEFLKTLKVKPVVIFTTAYQEYAIQGYELDVIDYLLKPITFERFLQGVNKAFDYIRLKRGKTDNLFSDRIQERPAEESINLKSDSKIYRVRYSEILYIEGLKEYVTYYTANRKYIVLESLKRLEEKLPTILLSLKE